MRPFASTISLSDARARLDSHVRPISRTERVALAHAVDRVAASDVASAMDVPPFARSAMDGYAVIAADTVAASRSAPRQLRIIERIYTGAPPHETVAPGTCAEIATGAPLPAGADAVVMVEDTTPAADVVDIHTAATAGQNIGRRGADIAAGDLVVRCEELLTPSRIGALAAVGAASVEVFARPRVAILSTGNEVVEPGAVLVAGRIFDVNRFTLGAIVGQHGGIAETHAPAHDTLDALTRAIDECADADVIVFSGGSSVGERDLIVDAVAARGEMIFHGIAVRPGKPTAFARIGGRVPFFGMPGNPTSCLSNAYILLIPFLRTTARLPPYRPRTMRLPLGRRITSPAGRHQFYTVRVVDGTAMPAFKGSGDITSLSRADGYIEIPPDRSIVEEGSLVDVTLF